MNSLPNLILPSLIILTVSSVEYNDGAYEYAPFLSFFFTSFLLYSSSPSYHPLVKHTNSVLHLSLCTFFLHKCDLYLVTIITLRYATLH
jgi:hypothetical protein